MTNEKLKRDAARYWRLRVLGCAPCETKQLENGTVLRFSNLDEFIDHDIKIRPSRGEAEVYENKTEGAAVSASPQPRCPKCGSFNVTIGYCDSPTQLGVHSATCRVCRTSCDSTGTMFAQFFAAAPAQEPDTDLLARYNRAYTILADALNLNPEFYGLVEMTQIVAKRLTGKYDAAQEQPVENSPRVSLKDFSVAKALEGFSKEPPQPTVFSPAMSDSSRERKHVCCIHCPVCGEEISGRVQEHYDSHKWWEKIIYWIKVGLSHDPQDTERLCSLNIEISH